MGVLATTAVKITADTANFHKDASRGVLKSIDSVGKDAESRAKKTFGAIGTAAKVAGAAGFIALGFAVKDVVSDFLEDDKAARQTAAVLKSTGGAANVTAGHVGRLATAIRNKTGIDDAAVQSGENMLLTFTKVRNETGKGNAIFDQATKATANLSAAMGKDMTSSAMLVGKALNDPIKGMSALSRAGIQFTEGQKETIKQMVKTGDTMGAQKIILKELETQFGGSAEAAGKSLGGQLNILKGRLEDMAGVLVAKVMPYLLRFVSFINANIPTIQRVFNEAFATIRQAIDIAVAAFKDLSSAAETVLGFLTEHVGSVKEMAVALGVGAAAVVVLTAAVKAYTIAQAALNAVMAANPITLVIIAIAALVVGLTLLYQRSETARKIMDAAWAGIKAGAQAALEFITNTLIPNAIAAWERFGPRVVAILQTAAAGIKTAVEVIKSVVTTVVDFVADHWEAAWKVIGPMVKAQFEVVKTTVQTALNVITGIIKVFDSLLQGDWSGAWNALKGIAKAALDGVVSIVGSILTGLAGTAKALATKIGEAIGAGVKAGLSSLAGLAGAIAGRIQGAAASAAGSAFAFMRQVGFGIADGVISGVGNLASRLADAVVGAAVAAKNKALEVLHIRSPSKVFADEVGAPMIQGIISGIQATQTALNAAMEKSVTEAGEHGGRGVEGVTKKMTEIFDTWAKNVSTKIAAGFDLAVTKINAEFAKAQAQLDKWKASLTPTEALIASMKAKAEYAAVEAAVVHAHQALDKLDADFKASWDKLLAEQAKNLAKLKATQAVTETDEAIAGHEFEQTLAGASPLAVAALNARKALDTAKQLYAEHKISAAELFAAQDAYDAASLAAQDTTDGQKLIQDYDTWQGLKKQTAEGNAGIAEQESIDNDARTSATEQYGKDRQSLLDGANQTLLDRDAFYLAKKAEQERTDRDARYEELSTGLKKRHDRTLTHVGHMEDMWENHFKAIIKRAKEDGKKFTDAYVDAIEDVAKPGGLLETAAGKLANVLKKYLKLNSPAEKGPLSDLDKWWDALAPTLIKSLDGSRIKAALSDAVTPSSGGFGPSAAGAAGRQTLSLNDGALMQKLGDLVDELKRNNQGASPVTVIASGGAQAAVIAARR